MGHLSRDLEMVDKGIGRDRYGIMIYQGKAGNGMGGLLGKAFFGKGRKGIVLHLFMEKGAREA